MKGSVGAQVGLIRTGLSIRPSLVTAITEANKEARSKRAPREFSGPKPAGKATPAKHADAIVLEVRRLHEQCGMGATAVSRHIASFGVDITKADARRYINYQSRALLVPAPDAEPYF